MRALIAGILAFFVATLGAMCPHELVYMPALFSVSVAGGYLGGTVFSLQSDGVYDLRIRVEGGVSQRAEARLGGIWAYGLVGVPAGAIALLIVARMIGLDEAALVGALSGQSGVAGIVRRVAVCLGVFAVTVIGGFLGLNLIRLVSDRVKVQIQREVSGQIAPLRLLEKGKLLMEEQSYAEALDVFRTLAGQDSTLLPVVWQGRALKRLGRLPEAIEVLKDGLRSRGATDERFRRAVARWNLGCYQASLDRECLHKEVVRSVIEALSEALRDAPEFRESLTPEALDADLVPLVGHPVFEKWRSAVLKRRAPRER